MQVPTNRSPMFKRPPLGRVPQLGNPLNDHLYRIDVGNGWHVEVHANTEAAAGAIARRNGYTTLGITRIC